MTGEAVLVLRFVNVLSECWCVNLGRGAAVLSPSRASLAFSGMVSVYFVEWSLLRSKKGIQKSSTPK